jgi:inositol oxygenase
MDTNTPLENLDDWEDDLLKRYPEPNKKQKEDYRNYTDSPRDALVRNFYKINHQFQTYDFVVAKQEEFLELKKQKMSVWEALDYLNTLVDDSDPDIELDQLQHLLQTAEAIRQDGHPDWFVLTGLLHDLGKVLCLYGEPQWAVVGDTYPVGCQFSDKIVYPEFFTENTDYSDERYNTKFGVYSKHCGLDQVKMSWGHDEYLYHVMKDYLPKPSLYIIRYHSFYAQHREGAYSHLMNEEDHKNFEWVKKFNPYDLYSKIPVPPDAKALKPYYEKLIAKYLPNKLAF